MYCFGTHLKSLYKQSHLDSLLGSRFDKLRMGVRLLENSVNTAGNAAHLMAAQININQLNSVV
jgi:hypothetical protein